MCDGVVFAHGFFDWVTVAPLGVRTGALRQGSGQGKWSRGSGQGWSREVVKGKWSRGSGQGEVVKGKWSRL